MNTREYGINYHPISGYMTFRLATGEPVFRSESKSECIGKAQELNRFDVVDGNEQTYAKQIATDVSRNHGDEP